MVLVAALVMHPGLTVALILTLRRIGAAGSLVVFDPLPELCGREFAQVVGQPLTVQPYPEAALAHQRPVVCHGFQMAPEIHGHYPSDTTISDTCRPGFLRQVKSMAQKLENTSRFLPL